MGAQFLKIKAVFLVELDSGIFVEHTESLPAYTPMCRMLEKYVRDGVTVTNSDTGTLTRYSPNVIRSITTMEVH